MSFTVNDFPDRKARAAFPAVAVSVAKGNLLFPHEDWTDFIVVVLD